MSFPCRRLTTSLRRGTCTPCTTKAPRLCSELPTCNLHHWETPVAVSPPTMQRDALLVGCIKDCRRLVDLAGGQPHPEIIYGPTCSNIRPLVEAHWSVESDLGLGRNPPPHPSPPNPLVDLLGAFLDKNGLLRVLERVGSFVLCQRLVAWLIYPAQETHSRLRFLALRPSQQNIAHSQWIDFLFWGQLRDVVLQTGRVRHGGIHTALLYKLAFT